MKTYKVIFAAFAAMVLGVFVISSCSSDNIEDNSKTNKRIIANPDVISEENLEILKAQALIQFNNTNFSIITNPGKETINYGATIEKLSQYDDKEIINYEEALGEDYNREYFVQLANLYEFSNQIISSKLFNINSSKEERIEYLEHILIYVFLNDIEYSTSSNCSGQFKLCNQKALRDHNIRIVGCTAVAVIAAVFTGGSGAATWPLCMASSGLFYESDINYCSDSYDLCKG